MIIPEIIIGTACITFMWSIYLNISLYRDMKRKDEVIDRISKIASNVIDKNNPQ